MTPTRHAIAARLRSLCAGARQDIAKLAETLRVEELSLRLSVDDVSPHPTFDVLVAAIRYFGVDAQWLVTGQYSTASHVDSIIAAEEGPADALQQLVASLSIAPLSGSAESRTPWRIPTFE